MGIYDHAMKVQPTPTSPKVRSSENVQALEQLYKDEGLQQLQQPTARKKSVSLLTVILSVFLGFASGMLGALVISVYPASDSLWVNRLFGTDFVQNVPVSQTRHQPKTTVVKQVSDAGKSLLAIYAARSGASLLQTTYFAEDQIGSALLFTDDGWAVTVRSVLRDDGQYVGITSDRKVLQVKTVIRDPASDLAFFRIDGAHYTPAPLDGKGDISQFDPYYAIAGNGMQQLARVEPVTFEELHARLGPGLESSDMITSGYKASAVLAKSFLGGAVIDRSGVWIGIIQSSDAGVTSVLPVSAIRQALSGVLREQVISRPALGAHYIDLARGSGISESLRKRRTNGAYLFGTTGDPAVLPRSAAAAAGLRSGDVIIKVNGQLLTETLGLSDALQSFAARQSIEITYVRDGTEKTVTVVLDEVTS